MPFLGQVVQEVLLLLFLLLLALLLGPGVLDVVYVYIHIISYQVGVTLPHELGFVSLDLHKGAVDTS